MSKTIKNLSVFQTEKISLKAINSLSTNSKRKSKKHRYISVNEKKIIHHLYQQILFDIALLHSILFEYYNIYVCMCMFVILKYHYKFKIHNIVRK